MTEQSRPSNQVTDRYNRDADVYRELWAPVLREAGRTVVRELSHGPVRYVLDLGTGVGALLPDLQSEFAGARIVGVDLSSGMLAHAPSGFSLAFADAAHLPFRSGSFDVVVMAFMLFHLEDPLQALLEAHRTLVPGGELACLTWEPENVSPAGKILSKTLDDFGAIPADTSAEKRHEALDAPEKMSEHLRSAGFQSIRTWSGQLSKDYDADTFLRLKTGFSGSKTRLESLSPEKQVDCLRRLRAGLAGLPPEAFQFRSGVVYSLARR